MCQGHHNPPGLACWRSGENDNCKDTDKRDIAKRAQQWAGQVVKLFCEQRRHQSQATIVLPGPALQMATASTSMEGSDTSASMLQHEPATMGCCNQHLQ